MRKDNYIMLELLAFWAIGFSVFSLFVINHIIDGFDMLVSTWVQSIRSDMLIQLSNILATVGAPKPLVRAAIGVAVLGMGTVFLFRRQRFNYLAPQFIVFGAINILAFYNNHWLKNLFHRSRPMEHFASYSYPSGHAMVSFVFYMTAAYLLWLNIPSKAGRVIIMLVCCLITLLIGLSRVYLGVHYPSDIIGGYFAGGVIVWVIAILLRWQQRRLN